MNLAFIGLGKMGMGMARNLLRAGHALAVYNRTPEKARALVADGARVANSPADACRDAQVVMTMVANEKKSIHGRNHIASSTAYVKEGKENNIK